MRLRTLHGAGELISQRHNWFVCLVFRAGPSARGMDKLLRWMMQFAAGNLATVVVWRLDRSGHKKG